VTQVSGGHGEKRSRREAAAIAALLSCPTIDAAAEQAGIAGSTLRGWLRDAAFQQQYREAQRQVVAHAIVGLQQDVTDARDALRRNLTCGVPAAEISAAKAIIEQAVKATESATVDRLEAIERLLNIEQQRAVS
jgi:hypothetical protein